MYWCLHSVALMVMSNRNCAGGGPELEEQLRREFDVEVRTDLRDSGGRNLIFHNGDLTRWRLTPTPYVENGIGTFSNYRFDARIFRFSKAIAWTFR